MADPHHALKHLVRVCLLCDLTLMLAWNAHEAGKIIETYKVYENKPADLIMERQEGELSLQVNSLNTVILFVQRYYNAFPTRFLYLGHERIIFNPICESYRCCYITFHLRIDQ